MLTIDDTLRSSMCAPLASALDDGTVEIRTGTRPATPGTSAAGTTLLATIDLAVDAFGNPAAGLATIVATAEVLAAASGTATWWRGKDSGGTARIDGSVTATGGGGDLTLSTVALTSGLAVKITGGTIGVPQGTV